MDFQEHRSYLVVRMGFPVDSYYSPVSQMPKMTDSACNAPSKRSIAVKISAEGVEIVPSIAVSTLMS